MSHLICSSNTIIAAHSSFHELLQFIIISSGGNLRRRQCYSRKAEPCRVKTVLGNRKPALWDGSQSAKRDSAGFPGWMFEMPDREARRTRVNRRTAIKAWIAEQLLDIPINWRDIIKWQCLLYPVPAPDLAKAGLAIFKTNLGNYPVQKNAAGTGGIFKRRLPYSRLQSRNAEYMASLQANFKLPMLSRVSRCSFGKLFCNRRTDSLISNRSMPISRS